MRDTNLPSTLALDREFLIACLCADWCDTCRDYRPGFEALAVQYPDADFLWVDIEDQDAWVGEFDVENSPPS
jgi:thioredoxin 1